MSAGFHNGQPDSSLQRTMYIPVESKRGHLGAVLEETDGSCQHLCRTPNHGTDVAVP